MIMIMTITQAYPASGNSLPIIGETVNFKVTILCVVILCVGFLLEGKNSGTSREKNLLEQSRDLTNSAHV